MTQPTLPNLQVDASQVDPGAWLCECGSDGRSCGCSSFWRDVREDGRKAKAAYNDRVWPVISNKLAKLTELGYMLEPKNGKYQVRINGVLDVYPQNMRFHDLRSNKRGDYRNLVKFVTGMLPLPQSNTKPNSQSH